MSTKSKYSEFERDLQLLDLNEEYSHKGLKAAYKLHAKVWHPDRFQHDEELSKQASEKLAEINNAYKNLKDFLDDPSFYTQEHEEVEADECQEAEAEEAKESSQEPESADNEIPEAGVSTRRATLCKLFNGIFILSFILLFATIVLNALDAYGLLGNKKDEIGNVESVLPDLSYLTFFVPLFIGFISYALMRHYSDKPEKYY
jgi:hypothetical protein